MDGARPVVEDQQHECPVCCAEAPYVLYDDDKMCRHCSHVPGSDMERVEQSESNWKQWVEHRDEEYSGWFGSERIKFPGGFVSAYDFGEDFDFVAE